MKHLKLYEMYAVSEPYSKPWVEEYKRLNWDQRDFIRKYEGEFNKETGLWDFPRSVRVSKSFGKPERNIGIKSFTIPFGTINGSFDCSDNYLETLENGPKEVYGDFNVSNNELTSIKGCPKFVTGNFNCSANKIKSLEEISYVTGDIFLMDNELTNLKGLPLLYKGKEINAYNNPLKSVEGLPLYIQSTRKVSGETVFQAIIPWYKDFCQAYKNYNTELRMYGNFKEFSDLFEETDDKKIIEKIILFFKRMKKDGRLQIFIEASEILNMIHPEVYQILRNEIGPDSMDALIGGNALGLF